MIKNTFGVSTLAKIDLSVEEVAKLQDGALKFHLINYIKDCMHQSEVKGYLFEDDCYLLTLIYKKFACNITIRPSALDSIRLKDILLKTLSVRKQSEALNSRVYVACYFFLMVNTYGPISYRY